ncbi:hypothetical protein [Sphingosinicella terrae]|uniref:hypothetical protein n=1 Tax=Sphingosinicella terrae TaxID=2172047 RepID=UPI000E0CDC9B|nr:hypothetical protein [Sphingosinicella terrae]
MADKVKIPKRVAGIKVPKKVRKKAKKALKATANPVVREFAAAAVGAATQARVDRWAGRAARPGAPPRKVVGVDPERLVEAVRDAAIDGFRRFLEGFEEGLRNAAGGDEKHRDEEEVGDAARERRHAGPDAGSPRPDGDEGDERPDAKASRPTRPGAGDAVEQADG